MYGPKGIDDVALYKKIKFGSFVKQLFPETLSPHLFTNRALSYDLLLTSEYYAESQGSMLSDCSVTVTCIQ